MQSFGCAVVTNGFAGATKGVAHATKGLKGAIAGVEAATKGLRGVIAGATKEPSGTDCEPAPAAIATVLMPNDSTSLALYPLGQNGHDFVGSTGGDGRAPVVDFGVA